MKQTTDDLAVFGGPPLFRQPRPIGQLSAPGVDRFLEVFRESYDARYLTNGGPVVRRLESQLAAIHETRQCIAVANAGLGIMMLMQLFAQGRNGEVIMPAFSYRGLPHFAQWAGQQPRFCDVDETNHGLDPQAVEACIGADTTSILAVANFNSAGRLEELCAVAARHEIPIFIDSVYAAGATHGGRMMGGFANAEVYSLHATKLLNGFEGGYITTDDDYLAEQLRWQRNFCLPGLQTPRLKDVQYLLGINAKLNEMHAAMALAALEELDAIIERNRARFQVYIEGLESLPSLSLLPYDDGERPNFQMAVVRVDDGWPLSRDQTVRVLQAEGATISAYYSPPLHLSEHCPAGMNVHSLPVSEALGQRYVQLPVGDLVSLADAADVCALLSFISNNGADIATRLKRENAA